MTDSRQVAELNRHPVNRLASIYLRHLRKPLDPSQVHLLTLVQVYLDQVPPDPDPKTYLEDFKQAVAELSRDDQKWVLELFLPDREGYQEELEEAGEAVAGEEKSGTRTLSQKHARRQVLEDNLGSLYQSLLAQKGWEAAANILVENLWESLQQVYPSLGPQVL